MEANMIANPEEMQIFTLTYDMLRWLLPHSERFPRAQRFVVTKRLQDAALDFQETIYLANAHSGRTREGHLRTADGHLNKLRSYLRLVHEWGWLNTRQYNHVSRMVAEVGRLLGGWLRQTQGLKK
jgi:hypothetical protein